MNRVCDKICLLVIAVVAISTTSCSSTHMSSPQTPQNTVKNTAPVTDVTGADQQTANITNPNSVYFKFNQHNVEDVYEAIIAKNCEYIMAHKNAKIQLQGHTDDIGPIEFNLALGQQRSNAVKEWMIANGASAEQIETVSYGRSKPKYHNSDTESRAKNRRVDIVYLEDMPTGYDVQSNNVDGSFYSGSVMQGIE
jgi:peptidoglycan-associated lipoprotein